MIKFRSLFSAVSIFLILFSPLVNAQEVFTTCKHTKAMAQQAKFELDLEDLAGSPAVDFIAVDKARKLMHLMQNGKVVKSYNVALGSSDGKKRQEGDKKTPEGLYSIGTRNSASKYHLSLEITYPNQDDIDWARKNGVSPGGDIMIHGLPNASWQIPFLKHPNRNWTTGCVAVTNEEIEEVWKLVKTSVPVEICP